MSELSTHVTDAFSRKNIPVLFGKEFSTETGFVFQYPPFPTLPETSGENIFTKETAGIYVHLPFCASRCSYCYYSVSCNPSPEKIEEYLSALYKDIDNQGANSIIQSHAITTAYFGGGTPTILSPEQIIDLSKKIRETFDTSNLQEYTIETTPTALTKEKTQAIIEAGFNRMSVGVQSFSDELNRLNERYHTKQHVLDMLAYARGSGMTNINLDIICGLTGETDTSWEQTIHDMMDASPEHITMYLLSLRPQTKAFNNAQAGNVPPGEEKRIEMYKYARKEFLVHGYIQTTPNCFIREPEFEHIHQTNAWKSNPLISFGNSAYSYVNNAVVQNVRTIKEYKQRIFEGKSPIDIGRHLTFKDEMARYAVLSIKRLGIDGSDFEGRFGFGLYEVFSEQINALQEAGLVEFKQNQLVLTETGILYADDVCRQFYNDDVRRSLLGQELENGRQKKAALLVNSLV